MDCAVQVQLQGIYEADLTDDVLVKTDDGDDAGDGKKKKKTKKAKMTYKPRPLSELRTGICMHILLLFLCLLDWIVQYVNEDEIDILCSPSCVRWTLIFSMRVFIYINC